MRQALYLCCLAHFIHLLCSPTHKRAVGLTYIKSSPDKRKGKPHIAW